MAKKKQELSPEERLAAALVPEEEQPYELPEGWRWIMVKGLCTLNNGKAFKPKDWKNSGIPIVRIQNLNDRKAIYHYYDGDIEDRFRLHGDELLFAWSGTPGTSFGAHIWHGKEAVLNQHIFRVDFDDKFLDKKFFKYALNQQLTLLINKAHGGAGLQHVTKKVMESTPICVPPFSEQQRIVARIESLFAKIDAAKEKVQSVLDAHEARKAALLHDAFTGKLTAKWRTEQGIDENVYRRVPLAEVCNSIFDGDHMPPPKSSSGIPFLVISNVNTGKVNFSDTRFVPQDYYDALTDTRKPQNGDVLYTLVGTYGIPVLVDTDQAFCFQRHMALLKPREDTVLQKYLWYALQERNFYREATKIAKGTAQLTVPIKGLRQLTIPMASLLEQQELVRILDRLLDREETVRQSAESVLESIDRMKQSILARAFRGEL